MNARTILPLTLLAAGLLAPDLACGRHEPAPAETLPTIPVRLVAGSGAAGDGWVAANLQRADQATLSTRLAGTVKRVLVDEGARVARGQLLMELEAGDVLGQLSAAEASRDAAAAHHRRIQSLLEKDAATPSELEGAAAQLSAAEAAVAAARSQLAFAQIRAPFAGTVQRREVQAGAFVGPGQPLMTVEGSGALELTASLSETESAGLKMGTALAFECEGREGEAVVTALATGGDSLSHRQGLRARVVKPTDLRTGAFARIRIPGARGGKGAVWVPLGALVERGELSGVFLAENGRAYLRWLDLGERNASSVEVRAGLDTGAPVIADPKGLRDGQPIVIQGEAGHAR